MDRTKWSELFDGLRPTSPSPVELAARLDTSSWITIDYRPGSPGFLYVIRDEGGKLYKVGISKDPFGRAAGLATGGARRLEVVAVVKAANERAARAAERVVHKELASSRVTGEWFSASESLHACIAEMLARGLPSNVVADARAQWKEDTRQADARVAIRAKLYNDAGRPSRTEEGIAGMLMANSGPQADALIGDDTGEKILRLIVDRAHKSNTEYAVIKQQVCELFKVDHLGLLKTSQRENVARFLVNGERPAQVSSPRPETTVVYPPERETVVNGWRVTFVEGAPMIEDEELGRRLGYSDPRKVRELIARIFNDSELMRTVRQTGGRPVSVAFLTERQAVKVCLRSETALANQIQDEVIEVFLAVRHGRAATTAAPPSWVRELFEGFAKQLLATKQDLIKQIAELNHRVDVAHHEADKSFRLAQQTLTLAGSRSVVDAIAQETPPGRSAETPDGAWSAKAPPGFRSMRAIARDFALPCDGAGANFVSRVASALGLLEDREAVSLQDVVIGGSARRSHVTYGPKAVAAMAPGLRAAHAVMTSYGYTVSHGVMHPIGVGPAKRAKPFVIEQMYEAALRKPVASPQTSIPGCERKAG
jgi:hypothetical protein